MRKAALILQLSELLHLRAEESAEGFFRIVNDFGGDGDILWEKNVPVLDGPRTRVSFIEFMSRPARERNISRSMRYFCSILAGKSPISANVRWQKPQPTFLHFAVADAAPVIAIELLGTPRYLCAFQPRVEYAATPCSAIDRGWR